MKISVILGHPSTESFNHAIADQCIQALRGNGHEVIYHDLYQERFGPILPCEEIPRGAVLEPDIERHCAEIAAADGIVIIHPNWWGMPPAMLKGWVDRVLRPGIAYEFLEGDDGEGVPIGLLKTATAIVFNTSNTQEERESQVFGDPLDAIWRHCIFGLCGVRQFYRQMFGVIVTSTLEQRLQWLEEVQATIDRFFPAVV
ncbi:MAG: NAD(P)H-dependent oxidoreductase [Thermacetogeniaceae bacterium]